MTPNSAPGAGALDLERGALTNAGDLRRALDELQVLARMPRRDGAIPIDNAGFRRRLAQAEADRRSGRRKSVQQPIAAADRPIDFGERVDLGGATSAASCPTGRPACWAAPTPVSQRFWDGLAQHRILIHYSPSADRYVFYPCTLAPGTLADDLEWREIGTPTPRADGRRRT
ncbi:hypothetical protein MSAR_04980 [Mycolicibacterium sarraceniae]|uniref:Uncharacterized protein n=1 Tax=Mycolicibacterium sarraceniae TaxID=1534348 RepID=A0A7I7SKA9_9MYCO|nr:hypothetical protein MSAR_04980 [Mycolicibacterium sarraceniae]